MKIIKLFIILIATFFYAGFLNHLNASEGTSALPVQLASDFQKILEFKGWHADNSGESLNAWKFNPSYHLLKVSINYEERDKDSFLIVINSERGGTETRKAFPFNKRDISRIDNIESILNPYLISLTNSNAEEEKKSDFYPTVKGGYYRTNDNHEILPEKSEGMFFIGWDLVYDPLRDADESTVPLYLGDYMDAFFKLSIDREGKKFFGKLDEFEFDINFVLYGKNIKKVSGEESQRNLYGVFTGIEYYRPYVTSKEVLWSDDVYTDHFHIQYCFWKVAEFVQTLTFTNGGKELSFKYEFGIGPGQNSSLTATNVTEDMEDDLNPIFVSNWYGKNDLGDRDHNYYWSMTVPVKLEVTADKYLNSKFDFKYHFYYFQSLFDKNAQDFLNRFIFNYGFYITEDITAGFGYEFWHIKSIENENNKSHYWNRFNIQMEMKL